MVNHKTQKIIIISAIITATFIYTGLVPVKNNCNLISLLPVSKINCLSGRLISNPVKINKNHCYRADFSPDFCWISEDFYGSAQGKISIFIPENIIEAFHPGKLFTLNHEKSIPICEEGFFIKINGTFSENGQNFYVKKAENYRPGKTFLSKLFYLRGIARLYFRRLMFSWGSPGGLFLALITGIKEYADQSLCENFRLAGLSHILALSGMHLNLFGNLSKKASLFIKNKILVFLIQIVFISAFVWFAGLSPSLLRALICSITSLVFSFLFNKKQNMIFILSFSFLLHSCIKPQDLMQISFQLSYGALAGILLLSSVSKFLISWMCPSFLNDSLSASIGAQGFTIPIAIKQIGSFSPIGVISTVFVSPLITVFIYSGLILFLLCIFIPAFVPAAAFLLKIFYNVIVISVGFFSKAPSVIIN